MENAVYAAWVRWHSSPGLLIAAGYGVVQRAHQRLAPPPIKRRVVGSPVSSAQFAYDAEISDSITGNSSHISESALPVAASASEWKFDFIPS